MCMVFSLTSLRIQVVDVILSFRSLRTCPIFRVQSLTGSDNFNLLVILKIPLPTSFGFLVV